MTWRFHFPLRNYDFNSGVPLYVISNTYTAETHHDWHPTEVKGGPRLHYELLEAGDRNKLLITINKEYERH